MRYFIYLAYDGTNYHGWQRQKNGITVQEVLDFATETSKKMWIEKLDYQIDFYKKLLLQVKNSELR